MGSVIGDGFKLITPNPGVRPIPGAWLVRERLEGCGQLPVLGN